MRWGGVDSGARNRGRQIDRWTPWHVCVIQRRLELLVLGFLYKAETKQGGAVLSVNTQ